MNEGMDGGFPSDFSLYLQNNGWNYLLCKNMSGIDEKWEGVYGREYLAYLMNGSVMEIDGRQKIVVGCWLAFYL